MLLEYKFPDLFLSCVSDPWYKVGRIAALPLEEESFSIPLLKLFTCEFAVLCHLSPMCGLTKYPVVGTALNPTLTVGMSVNGPAVSQLSPSLGHQVKTH